MSYLYQFCFQLSAISNEKLISTAKYCICFGATANLMELCFGSFTAFFVIFFPFLSFLVSVLLLQLV